MSVVTKKMLVPKYVIILLVYSILNFDLHSDIMVVHRKTSASGQSKLASAQVTARKAAAPEWPTNQEPLGLMD
jgi:hypothetical protein